MVGHGKTTSVISIQLSAGTLATCVALQQPRTEKKLDSSSKNQNKNIIFHISSIYVCPFENIYSENNLISGEKLKANLQNK